MEKFLGLPSEFTPGMFVLNSETGLYCVKDADDAEMDCVRGELDGSTDNARSKLPRPAERKLKNFYKYWNEEIFKNLGRDLHWND